MLLWRITFFLKVQQDGLAQLNVGFVLTEIIWPLLYAQLVFLSVPYVISVVLYLSSFYIHVGFFFAINITDVSTAHMLTKWYIFNIKQWYMFRA